MTLPLRATHVVAGLAQAHGGPSYVVTRLCQALAEQQSIDIELLAVAQDVAASDDFGGNSYRRRLFAQSYAQTPFLGALRLSAGLTSALRRAAPQSAVVHGHGLWLAPNLQAGWAAARAGKPLVVSPHGMLSPTALAFSPMKKQLAWWAAQRRGLRAAACLHATSDAEHSEFRALGLTNPIAVIGNGIDLPGGRLLGRSASARAGKTVLSLGRIHPKKALDRLINAWATLEARFPDWKLRIVGPAEEGADRTLRTLAASLNLSRVTIEGPIYAPADKQRLYEDADLFVLPTLNENFGVTVAEALAHGVPVISTTGAPWSGLRAEGCGWWIEQGVDVLAAALTEAMATPSPALAAMGARGRAWMERDFSWTRIAKDMADVYRWLAHGADSPACVRFD